MKRGALLSEGSSEVREATAPRRRLDTVVDLLARQAEIRPDAPFLTEGDTTLSFAGFLTRVRRHAGFLAAQGIGPGDRVVLAIDRRLPHLLAYFASMVLGAIPVHMLVARGQRSGALLGAHHTAARLVLTDVPIDDAGFPCPCLLVPDVDAQYPEHWTSRRDPTAYILFTSGTTGEPKAALTTHENLLFVTRTLIGIPGMRTGDKEVIVMPLAATGGLGHVHANLMLGNHAILMPGFFSEMTDGELSRILSVIEREKVTGFLSTPGMLGRFAETHREEFRSKLQGVRYILANVTPMRPALARDLMQLLPETRFYTYYGLTEASRSVYFCFNDHREQLRAAGRPTPGVTIRLAKSSPDSDMGEVLIKGGNVVSGYWGRPGLGFDADGWFRTGDLGSFDEDGFLTIHGRLKDTIKVDGMECFPHEVEAVLESHPAVKEAAVLAVPDALTYERVGAAVVPVAGANTGQVADELTRLFRERLVPSKRPTQLLFLEALPRVGAGKVDRATLREKMTAAAGGPPAMEAALRELPKGTAPGAVAFEEFRTPVHAAFERFRQGWTPAGYRTFREGLGRTLGVDYDIDATPFFLERDRFATLAATTEALLRLMCAPAYQAETAATPWFLPQTPIDARDCFGSVDFNLGPEGARIIEVNFFPPGFVGMLEMVERQLFDAFRIEGIEPINAGFEADMVDLVSEGGKHRKLALAVSHLAASEPYRNHYRYVARCFEKRGIACRMVFAKDVSLDDDGFPVWDGERFERVFTLVIPRVMEHGPAPFARFIELFHRRPEVIYPRPFGWKLGMKRLLADLDRLQPGDYGLSPEDYRLIRAVTLPALCLAEVEDAAALTRYFGGRRFVLKPFDNYDRRGLFLHPGPDDIARILREEKSHYIAQAWFPHSLVPLVTPRGEVAAHQFSLRMGFLNGRCRGIRGASFADTRIYDDYYTPVLLA